MPKNPLENSREGEVVDLDAFRKEKGGREGDSRPSAKRILTYVLIALLGNAALVMTLSDYYRTKVLDLLGMQPRSSDRLIDNKLSFDEEELARILGNKNPPSEQFLKEASKEALKIADERIKKFNFYLTILFKKRDGGKLTPEEENQWKEFTYYFPYDQKYIAKLKKILSSQIPTSEIEPSEIEKKTEDQIALFSVIEKLYAQINSAADVSSKAGK